MFQFVYFNINGNLMYNHYSFILFPLMKKLIVLNFLIMYLR